MIDKVKPLIEMKEIIKAYNIGLESEIEILHGIDLKIYEGEFVAIVGESGSGKSTLMNIIGVLDKQTEGEYYLDGIDIKNANEEEMNVIRNKKIGFVFQNFNLIGRTSALKNVELPMLYAGVPAEERTKRAKELLSKVGMASRANHMPNELSGGQKQRVAIAGILAIQPKCIIFDEPTAMLDPSGRREVMENIKELNKKHGITVILITHYMDEAAQADRVVVMDKGKVIMEGIPRDIFSEVETMKKIGLDVPQVTEICYELKKAGINIDTKILNVNEMVNALCQLK